MTVYALVIAKAEIEQLVNLVGILDVIAYLVVDDPS